MADKKTSFVTAMVPATHHRDFLHKLRVLLVFIEFNILICIMISRDCSDAQISNKSDLREKIEDGSLGLPAPEPQREGGPDLHYFLLRDDPFALMPWIRAGPKFHCLCPIFLPKLLNKKKHKKFFLYSTPFKIISLKI